MILTTFFLSHITTRPKKGLYLRDEKKRKNMERTKVAGQSQADLEDGDEKLDAILQSDEIDAMIEEALRDATEDL